MAAKKKVTIYLPERIINQTKQEALRQDRSLSWVLEMAWLMAREKLQAMPGLEELGLDDLDVAS